jgi:predicted nucleotidyltransferase
MGADRTNAAEVLFTKTQRRVLGLLFGHPQRSFYSNEIVRAAGAGIGTVQRELARLAGANLVTVARRGNQKHYQANPAAPIFDEMVELVRKTVGELEVKETPGTWTKSKAALRTRGTRTRARVRGELEIPFAKLNELCRRYHVKQLSLFGSAARGELTPASDVDVMVEFKPGRAPSLWDSPGIVEELSTLFGNRRVDIVSPEILRNPFRRKTIVPDLKVLYEAR